MTAEFEADKYRQRRTAYVLRRLEQHSVQALYLVYSYPNLSRDFFSVLEQSSTKRIVIGKPSVCLKLDRARWQDCLARLSPPQNGDNFLWCLDNHGVVFHGPFAGLWVEV